MRGASEGFKNEFLKNELLKDWIKILKYLCINKVDTKFEYPKWIFWNFVSTKNSQDFPKFFENIQFPTSHMEAENPFGLVFIEKTFFHEKNNSGFVKTCDEYVSGPNGIFLQAPEFSG